ncbi:uncharacterized protein G2W53_044553 [Senna tora]|uniref:Uncharacterized protein n=1 Tax=Senna tora TaxID=362788 RepID=A0A834SD10_9FABA|nr:uncharacterized protein G2W53_044553 [Senna tora]
MIESIPTPNEAIETEQQSKLEAETNWRREVIHGGRNVCGDRRQELGTPVKRAWQLAQW